MNVRSRCARAASSFLLGLAVASAPAHAGPTTCTIDEGSVVLSAGARLRIEIGGDTPCSGFDRYIVQQALTINGATLEIVLAGGYVPGVGARFDVLDWGTLSGGFGAIDVSAAALPDGLGWDTARIPVSGELVVTGPLAVTVPWPAWSAGLLSAVLLTHGRRSRRALERRARA